MKEKGSSAEKQPLWCFHETSTDLEDPVTGSQCSGQDHYALEKFAQSRIYDPTTLRHEMLERGGIMLHNTYKPLLRNRSRTQSPIASQNNGRKI